MCILCQLGASTLQSRLNSDSTGLLGSDPLFSSNNLLEIADPLQSRLSVSSSSFSLSSNETVAAQQVVSVTTDLILDFDGGLVQTGQGYDLPTIGNFNGFTFTGFTPFDRNDGASGNLNGQILQIVAGVREDYANFNVRVIWDDRGVNSPFYDNQDTVVMIVGESGTAVGTANDFGRASNVDAPAGLTQDNRATTTLQSRRDVAFAFLPEHVTVSPQARAFSQIRELIDTTSHEGSHTFGISHSTQPDSQQRQMMTTRNVTQNRNLDSRFSPESLNRDEPEDNPSVSYSEVDRLNQAVGAATILPGDTQSSQTLPMEPNTPLIGTVPSTGFLSANGAIDFLGDRDAFRFEVGTTDQYTLRQLTANGSLLNPVVTLWNAAGDFAVAGTGTASTIIFDAVAGETYYAVAGSDVDRATTFIDSTTNASVRGNLPVGQTGAYVLQIGKDFPPTAVDDRVTTFENIPITSNVLTNDTDPDGNSLTASLIRGSVNGNLVFNSDGSFTYTPNSDFFGSDNFTYQASDRLATSEPATVFITINEAPLIDLIGTAGRDVLTGNVGRNRIIGLQSGDILTGGAGRDQFVYLNVNEGGDRITDFTIGKDKIVLTGVLNSINYGGSNPFADGFMSFRQASNSLTVIQIDPDGLAGGTFRPAPFILLDNILIADLSDLNNFVL